MSGRTEQQRADLVAAAEGLMALPGPCSQCDTYAERRITICIHHATSGPGVSVYGCIPCARKVARTMFAPSWLRDDLATIDAAEAAKETGR